MKCDLHMHSNYSFDSLMSPANIVRASKLRNLSVISVTDHDNMKIYDNEFSPENRKRIFETHGIRIIPGMEVTTECGDIIGLFLDSPISGSDFINVVDQIRNQDGLVVLPHPYHRNVDPTDLVPNVDILEIVNGRSRSDTNERAAKLARDHGCPTLGGSDGHMYWEIGHIHTCFSGISNGQYIRSSLKRLLLNNERDIRGEPLPYLMTHGVSYASGQLKRAVGRLFG